MNPTPSAVHVDQVLTDMSIAYLQSADDFVADKVFPRIPVRKQSDRYAVFSKGDFARDVMKKRAPGTQSSGGGWNVDTTPTYYCDVYAHHKLIDNQTRANADSWAQLDRMTTEYLTRLALIRREKDFVANFFTTSKWDKDVTGVSSNPVSGTSVLQWDDPSSASDPIGDIRYYKRYIQERTMTRPNQLTLGRAVYDALLDHPDIIDRLKYGQTAGAPAMADRNRLAQLFEVDQIHVMDAVENVAEEGQTASMAFIGGKHALLTYSPRTPTIAGLMSGATFVWTGLEGSQGSGGQSLGTAISKWWDQDTKSDKYEIEAAFDQKVVCADLGVFFNGIVA